MSVDLIAFVRARLDEDEAAARAVEDRSAPWDGQWVADGNDAARTFNGHVLFYGHNGPLKPGLVQHVVRHDPARVLRQVAAMRAVVDRYEHAALSLANTEPGTPPHDIMSGAVNMLRDALGALAAIWQDHPDYQPGWAP